METSDITDSVTEPKDIIKLLKDESWYNEGIVSASLIHRVFANPTANIGTSIRLWRKLVTKESEKWDHIKKIINSVLVQCNVSGKNIVIRLHNNYAVPMPIALVSRIMDSSVPKDKSYNIESMIDEANGLKPVTDEVSLTVLNYWLDYVAGVPMEMIPTSKDMIPFIGKDADSEVILCLPKSVILQRLQEKIKKPITAGFDVEKLVDHIAEISTPDTEITHGIAEYFIDKGLWMEGWDAIEALLCIDVISSSSCELAMNKLFTGMLDSTVVKDRYGNDVTLHNMLNRFSSVWGYTPNQKTKFDFIASIIAKQKDYPLMETPEAIDNVIELFRSYGANNKDVVAALFVFFNTDIIDKKQYIARIRGAVVLSYGDAEFYFSDLYDVYSRNTNKDPSAVNQLPALGTQRDVDTLYYTKKDLDSWVEANIGDRGVEACVRHMKKQPQKNTVKGILWTNRRYINIDSLKRELVRNWASPEDIVCIEKSITALSEDSSLQSFKQSLRPIVSDRIITTCFREFAANGVVNLSDAIEASTDIIGIKSQVNESIISVSEIEEAIKATWGRVPTELIYKIIGFGRTGLNPSVISCDYTKANIGFLHDMFKNLTVYFPEVNSDPYDKKLMEFVDLMGLSASLGEQNVDKSLMEACPFIKTTNGGRIKQSYAAKVMKLSHVSNADNLLKVVGYWSIGALNFVDLANAINESNSPDVIPYLKAWGIISKKQEEMLLSYISLFTIKNGVLGAIPLSKIYKDVDEKFPCSEEVVYKNLCSIIEKGTITAEEVAASVTDGNKKLVDHLMMVLIDAGFIRKYKDSIVQYHPYKSDYFVPLPPTDTIVDNIKNHHRSIYDLRVRIEKMDETITKLVKGNTFDRVIIDDANISLSNVPLLMTAIKDMDSIESANYVAGLVVKGEITRDVAVKVLNKKKDYLSKVGSLANDLLNETFWSVDHITPENTAPTITKKRVIDEAKEIALRTSVEKSRKFMIKMVSEFLTKRTTIRFDGESDIDFLARAERERSGITALLLSDTGTGVISYVMGSLWPMIENQVPEGTARDLGEAVAKEIRIQGGLSVVDSVVDEVIKPLINFMSAESKSIESVTGDKLLAENASLRDRIKELEQKVMVVESVTIHENT